MDRISAVIITKNEAQNIERCLKALTCVDEVVVLDTGSVDSTVEICEKLGCKVSQCAWEGFGKAKRRAVELASNDWILSIDADEVLAPALQAEISNLAKIGFGKRAYRIKRRSFYLGKLIRFCGWSNDAPLRIFNRSRGNFNDKTVHESVVTSDPRLTLKNYMLHYTYPTLESHFNKMRLYAELGASREHEQGHKSDSISPYLRAVAKFFKMFILKFGFLDGYRGFLLCKNSAWGVWYKYHLLWKLSR